MFLSILTLIGALGMFLYGMNMMSSGLQKAAGDGLRRFVASMTSNPLKGVTTGLGVTAVIQSSSATTVMVVSFVNAGILTLTQAIGVIMGANIGTTFTAWIISLFGFSADISILAVPLMAIGFVMGNAGEFAARFLRNDDVPLWLLLFGSAGQVLFTLRFVYQWIYSNHKGESQLPAGFWIISLIGSLSIVTYGCIRLDPVLIVGQSFGVVSYVRNLCILKNEKKALEQQTDMRKD